MNLLLAEISAGEIWMIALTAGMLAVMAIGTFWKKTDVQVQQPLDVQLAEARVSQDDFNAHKERVDKELSLLWTTVRTENTAIRREITDAVSHSQEVLMEKLENNRVELAGRLDHLPSRVIADLRNAKGLMG